LRASVGDVVTNSNIAIGISYVARLGESNASSNIVAYRNQTEIFGLWAGLRQVSASIFGIAGRVHQASVGWLRTSDGSVGLASGSQVLVHGIARVYGANIVVIAN